MDSFNPAERSQVMRAVKSRDTGIEMTVRRLLHRQGFRYRLHRKDLPGKPDIVFPSRRKVIFVHGCFWHQHPVCHHADRPASNSDYWNTKLNGNVARDAKHIAALQEQGWRVLIVWECFAKDKNVLLNTMTQFLQNGEKPRQP